jgi:hypothetical protein
MSLHACGVLVAGAVVAVERLSGSPVSRQTVQAPGRRTGLCILLPCPSTVRGTPYPGVSSPQRGKDFPSTW